MTPRAAASNLPGKGCSMSNGIKSDAERHSDPEFELEGMSGSGRPVLADSSDAGVRAGEPPAFNEQHDPVAPGEAHDDWVSAPNHRRGQFWDGGPRPLGAPPPEPAAPSSSKLFQRKGSPSDSADDAPASPPSAQ